MMGGAEGGWTQYNEYAVIVGAITVRWTHIAWFAAIIIVIVAIIVSVLKKYVLCRQRYEADHCCAPRRMHGLSSLWACT